VHYEWDDDKAASNRADHGVSFDQVEKMNWSDMVVIEDSRRNYGEPRYIGYSNIGRRLYCIVFTLRGETIRVISLRKANSREVKRYG